MPDRSRPPILYLSHRLPYPPDKGDRIRTFHTLRCLAQRAEVYLLSLADEPVPEADLAVLKGLCARVAVFPLGRAGRWLRALASLATGGTVSVGAFASSALSAMLADWARQTPFHAALVSASSLAPYLRLPALRGVPGLVDVVDVDSQKWLDYAQASRGPKAWLYRTEGVRLRRLEADLPSWTRAVTLVSEAETVLYRDFAASGEVVAVTNGVDLDYFHPQPEAEIASPPSCLFVGALDYRPNVDAACWFSEAIWPAVRARVPEGVFRLVGRRPAAAVQALARLPGIEVIGQVPDVRPHVAAATAIVAPLRIARGLQNKVLEALAMGKAVVASPPSLGGFRLEPGRELLMAANLEEWVSELERVFRDAALRRRLGEAGRRYAEERHDWNHCLQPFFRLLGLEEGNLPRETPVGATGDAGRLVS